MQIVSFNDFARRRSIPLDPIAQAAAAPLAPVTDRWAQLHTESRTAEIIDMTPANLAFFDDLQLRMAYPTLHLRHS